VGVVASRQASREAAARILERLEAHGFAGADPYDALNAARVPARVMSTKRGRQLVTQAVKRSPVELRRLLGVPTGISAYTLGHVLSACSRLSSGGTLPDASRLACRVADLLRGLALPGFSGACWGYHFDVQTRFFFYAKTAPNVIATAFAVKGLWEATEAGLLDASAQVMSACDFILSDLPRAQSGDGQSFGYIPTSDTVVHNANMLAALVLVLGVRAGAQGVLVQEALRAARFVVSHQRDDGAWPYSERTDGRWVDGFHTGFVLEGLNAVAVATEDAELGASVQRGLNYYLDHFVGAQGEPNYYDDRALPYDALSTAEGIEVLGLFAGNVGAREARERLTAWALENMVAADGRVAYRVTARGTDWREYPRWSAAPMCSALASVGER
jgi:hypothetical protein